MRMLRALVAGDLLIPSLLFGFNLSMLGKLCYPGGTSNGIMLGTSETRKFDEDEAEYELFIFLANDSLYGLL